MQTNDLRKFMARVVPWPGQTSPGLINLHWTAPPRDGGTRKYWGGRPSHDLDDFIGLVNWAKTRPKLIHDLYFCLSCQSSPGPLRNGKRTAQRLARNAVALKAIWLDIDVKKPPHGYETFEEACKALGQFTDAAGIPIPNALVNSGSPGLHAYWISDRPLTVDDWRRYAEGLRVAAEQYGLRCDYSVTIDAARILRVPGTSNFKKAPPAPVELLGIAEKDYNFEKDLAKLLLASNAPPATAAPVDLGPVPAWARDLGTDALGYALTENDTPPLAPEPVFEGCPFYMDALQSGGANHDQPQWNLAVLGTTFMETGETVAHRIGNKHKGYTVDSTTDMFNRKMRERTSKGLGWPSCKAIEQAGSKFCAGCANKGKIKSPLHLALEHKATTLERQVAAVAKINSPPDMYLPKGYEVDGHTGYISKVEEKAVLAGPPIWISKPLFLCKITAPWTTKDPTELGFIATTHRGGSRAIQIPLVALATTPDLTRALTGQDVKFHPEHQENLRTFCMSWIETLQKAKDSLTSLPFGWYEDGGKRRGFSYGGTLMKDDGTELPTGFKDSEIRRYYGPTGTEDLWWTLYKIIMDQNRPELECILATAFAAPLMVSTGEYSGQVSAFGESGGHKSTAIKCAVAVWGSPKYAREGPDTTHKSLVKKMGDLKNLPVYWDEIKDDAGQKKLYNTMFSGSEGTVGGRLTTNIVQRPKTGWQTLLVTGSNLNFIDFIMTQQKTTEAGINRVFEFEVPKVEGTEHATFEVSLIAQDLEANYGMVGMRYARWLALNAKEAHDTTVAMQHHFRETIKQQNDERFWNASCSVLLAGATLANKVLGCTFHLDAMETFLIASYEKMRKRRAGENVGGGTEKNTENILTAYLRHMIGNTVWTDTAPEGVGRKKVKVYHGPRLDMLRPVYVQFAKVDRLLRMAKGELRDYLHERNISPFIFQAGLTKHFAAEEHRARVAPHTPHRGGQETVIDIPIPEGSVLEPLMDAHETEALDDDPGVS